MKLLMFTIRDIKADAYNTPFFFTTEGQALRAFQDLCNDQQSTINKHPEDYALYFTGTFETTTGDFEALPHPRHLMNANAFESLNGATPLRVAGES